MWSDEELYASYERLEIQIGPRGYWESTGIRPRIGRRTTIIRARQAQRRNDHLCCDEREPGLGGATRHHIPGKSGRQRRPNEQRLERFALSID